MEAAGSYYVGSLAAANARAAGRGVASTPIATGWYQSQPVGRVLARPKCACL
jgi:hypothetical protein